MTIIGGLTWHLRLVTFVHVPFSPPPLLILALQPILFHTNVTDGHYILFSIEELVCIVLTQCFCFASSVWFGSFKNSILSGFVREWCFFPSRRLLYTSICLSIFAFLRSMFVGVYPSLVDFVRYLTFWQDMIQIYRCSRKTSVDYFVCSICRYGIDQALFHQLKVFG